MTTARASHRAAKIAISLSQSLFRRIERARKEAAVARSAFVQQALEEFLARRERASLVERYIEGYRREPEGHEEVDAARNAAAELLAREPWE